MAEPFIGQITMFAGTFAPRGWAFCDGQLLAVSQFSAVFSLLGTTYGGDGRTTFGLPDLRGRVPVHQGTGSGLPPVNLGMTFGGSTILTKDNLPPIQMPCSSATATQTSPVGNAPADGGRTRLYGSDFNDAGPFMGPNLGGSQVPIDFRPPSLGINFIIALVGLFPSRN